MFAASNADELRIEPDTKLHFLTGAEPTEIDNSVVTPAIVSQLVFPIIPLEEKLRLSSLPQISFRHTNDLGLFGVTVAKSPSGLTASVKKINVPQIEPEAGSTPPASVGEASAQPNRNPASLSAPSPFASASSPAIAATQFQNGAKTAATPTIVSEKLGSPALSPLSKTSSGGANLPGILDSLAEELEETYNQDSSPSLPPPQNPAFTPPAPAVAPSQQSLENSTSPDKIAANGANGAVSKPASTGATAAPKMDALFYQMAEQKASDLHLSVSIPPMIRKDGKMALLQEGLTPVTTEAMRDLLYSIMPERNREEFERRHDTDFAYEIKGLARFRANVFMDRKGMGGVFRIIPTKILTAEQLGLSKAILDLCNLNKGLVVVTGPTGSGKSTTLCAMIDHVNKNRQDHIITIEDPIEFVHENQNCVLNQREVHNHTDSFKDALRAALREDPDILLVGEMRDLETISIAIETAETGHLVFGTLHTTTAPSTVDRIIDQFPADRQQQIRVMLSESLRGVIAQTLLPKIGGGRIAALEVLIITPAISNLIREGKTFQIASAMQTGKQYGMTTLNDSLVELVMKGLVEPRQAYLKAVDKGGIEALFKRNEINIAKFKEIFD